jgi:hypothetical protein
MKRETDQIVSTEDSMISISESIVGEAEREGWG